MNSRIRIISSYRPTKDVEQRLNKAASLILGKYLDKNSVPKTLDKDMVNTKG